MCMYGDWVVRNNVIQVIIINVRQRYTSMPKEKTEKGMELAVVRKNHARIPIVASVG